MQKFLALFAVLLISLSAAEPKQEQDDSLITQSHPQTRWTRKEPHERQHQPLPPPEMFLMTERQLRNREIILEGKAAWYYPTSKHFRNIYGWGNGIYSLEANFEFAKNWYAYSSGSFFIAHGHSEGISYKTTIWFLPITLGIKYLRHHIAYDYLWAWYAGLGGVGTYMQIHDHDPFISQHIDRWGGGGNAQLGGIWYVTEHFLIDLFAQYTFNYVPTKHQTANLSGLSLGGGIGWTF